MSIAIIAKSNPYKNEIIGAILFLNFKYLYIQLKEKVIRGPPKKFQRKA